MNKRGHLLNAALLSVGVAYLLRPAGDAATVRTALAVGVPVVLGSLLPDADTAVGRHRKTLHNLPVLLAVAAFPAVFGNLRYVWIGVLSHYVLDAVGSRRGIALLYPVSDREYGLPTGVPVDDDRAATVTAAVTALELAVAGVVLHVLPRVGGVLAGIAAAAGVGP